MMLGGFQIVTDKYCPKLDHEGYPCLFRLGEVILMHPDNLERFKLECSKRNVQAVIEEWTNLLQAGC